MEWVALLRKCRKESGVGIVARVSNDYPRAGDVFSLSLIAARELVTSARGYAIARGLSHLARTLYLQGMGDEAAAVFHEALTTMQGDRMAGHALADCLDWVASLALAQHQLVMAARLFGAAESQWQVMASTRYLIDQMLHERDVADVKASLDPQRFDVAFAEGSQFSVDQAIACALEATSSTAVTT